MHRLLPLAAHVRSAARGFFLFLLSTSCFLLPAVPAVPAHRYGRLLEAGYTRMRMRVQPEVGHEGSTAEEADLLCEALEAWGLLKPPKKK